MPKGRAVTVTGPARALQQVTSWFETQSAAGLILPGGWFGRPYDNQHQLTWAQARPTKLVLELDHRLLLVLTEPGLPRPDGASLVVPFRQLVFDWQECGTGQPHADSFKEGVLTFASPRKPPAGP
jgi:hypothetical protein